jgi:hypothetical protein
MIGDFSVFYNGYFKFWNEYIDNQDMEILCFSFKSNFQFFFCDERIALIYYSGSFCISVDSLYGCKVESFLVLLHEIDLWLQI